MRYSLEFSCNFNNKFDIKGFSILDKTYFDIYTKIVETLKTVDIGCKINIGVEQEIAFETIANFLDCIKVKEIDDKTAGVIITTIGENYGLINVWQEVNSLYTNYKLGCLY